MVPAYMTASLLQAKQQMLLPLILHIHHMKDQCKARELSLYKVDISTGPTLTLHNRNHKHKPIQQCHKHMKKKTLGVSQQYLVGSFMIYEEHMNHIYSLQTMIPFV